ncbi:MAG: Hpt domain-containing protein [Bacteroidales bacterium]|nr:Hpt domain-containing protein [Candidatus Latescibacterota bacterium]
MGSTTEIYDSSILNECLDGDKEMITEIIEGYFDDMAGRMDEMVVAILSCDAELIHRTGHSIKGASANIGAKEASSVASEIEKAGKAGNIEKAKTHFEEFKTAFSRLESHLGK